MIKASISLQDLRRRIYAKAKADSVGTGGVGSGCIRWCEVNRKAQYGKTVRWV